MKSTTSLVLLLTLSGTAGCAHDSVPPELATARTVYQRASTGPAASVNPTDLHTAKESLDAAEQSFANDGDSQTTKDLAYAAERNTETAEARARTMLAVQQKDQVLANMHAEQTSQVKATSEQLGKANQQLASQGAQLTNERQGRQDAEKRAAQAAADLAKFAAVKQEPRGMVITLSGGVLFASAKSDLLPAAQLKLNDVAKALTEQDPDSKMVVEGHTDTQGAMAFNQDLSQKRAEAVRAYLVSRGISSDRISAQGFGQSRSVADNGSAEGRANNRRVEIVVQPVTK